MYSRLYQLYYRTGIAEAVSFLLLLGIAMPLKYLAGMPAAVTYTGMAHGWLFVAYVALAVMCYRKFTWPFSRLVWAVAAAFVPLGPFWFHKKWPEP